MGGDLTSDEIGVIRGALDLTSKTARSECTPLDKVPLQIVHIDSTPTYAKPTETLDRNFVPGIAMFVHSLTSSQAFMLPADMMLDEEALFKILRYGHSRIPVYEPGE